MFQKHMQLSEFAVGQETPEIDMVEPSFTQLDRTFQQLASDKWQNFSHLILNERKEVFRNSLVSINNGLYLELDHMTKKRKQNKRKSSVMFKSSKNLIDSCPQTPQDNKRCSLIPSNKKLIKLEQIPKKRSSKNV